MVHIARLNFEKGQNFSKRIFGNYAESAGKKMPGYPPEFDF